MENNLTRLGPATFRTAKGGSPYVEDKRDAQNGSVYDVRVEDDRGATTHEVGNAEC